MTETITVDRDYLWALEVIARAEFAGVADSATYHEARMIVANRTGQDAPFALEGDE